MSNYTSADVPESSRVVIDPVTRIEGHLRVEMEAGDGVIKNAWTSTTQYRGIEVIACKRDPRDVWAFVERICGVCTGTHAIAALAAVEDALQYPCPSRPASCATWSAEPWASRTTSSIFTSSRPWTGWT